MTVGDRERAQAMALRYARGDTLRAIAADFGVTKEAVRRMLLRSGYLTRGAAQRARQAQARARRTDRKAAVIAWLEQDPQTLTRAEAAELLGMSAERLVHLIGVREANRLLAWASGERPPRYNDEQILEALRTVSASHGEERLTRAGYDGDRDSDMPSAVLIIQRFGTWSAACDAAGVEPGGRPGTYRNRRSDEELLGYLRHYLAEAKTFAYSEYEQMARERGWPSGAYMRIRFGTWNGAKATASQSADSPQDDEN